MVGILRQRAPLHVTMPALLELFKKHKEIVDMSLKDMRMQGLPSMVPLSGPGPEHGESKCGLAEQKKCAALVTIGGSSFSSSSVPA